MIIETAKRPTKDELKSENEFSTHEIFITKDQIDEFDNLLAKGAGEKTIDEFLTANPEIFTSALHTYRTGHHRAIIIPKQEIKPRIKITDEKGLIPDFIIGGKNSDGWNWWVIELKGTTQTIFSESSNEIYFNTEINKGICQLLEYIDFCSENQSNLRDVFKLENFREPNGLIIAGRERELNDNIKKQKLKAAWNRINLGKLEIRTYDFLQQNLKLLFDFRNAK